MPSSIHEVLEKTRRLRRGGALSFLQALSCGMVVSKFSVPACQLGGLRCLTVLGRGKSALPPLKCRLGALKFLGRKPSISTRPVRAGEGYLLCQEPTAVCARAA